MSNIVIAQFLYLYIKTVVFVVNVKHDKFVNLSGMKKLFEKKRLFMKLIFVDCHPR